MASGWVPIPRLSRVDTDTILSLGRWSSHDIRRLPGSNLVDPSESLTTALHDPRSCMMVNWMTSARSWRARPRRSLL